MKPVRLGKRQESLNSRVEAWVLTHANLLLLLTIILLLILFVCVCFFIVGLSTTETGLMRNFINGGI